MSRQMLIRSVSPSPSQSVSKHRPLLRHSRSSASSSSRCSNRFAEVVGGTTAECAAIACCCPCGLVNLLILTVYKVPAGLCRRALRSKRRRRMIKKGLLQPGTKRCKCGLDDTELQIHPVGGSCVSELDLPDLIKFDLSDDESEEDEEVEAMVKLEEEMWETFYSTGFWRSPSQREQPKRLTTSASQRETSMATIKVIPQL